MGRPGEESETLVHERLKNGLESRVPRDTRNPCGKPGGPPSKAKYYLTTDRGKYREGKAKRTAGAE